jgi:hypothetical protein
MKVRFCAACGRIILATFSFCPYCGAAIENSGSIDEIVEPAFEKLEHDVLLCGRIDRMIAELDGMEHDLAEIIGASEPTSSR